MGWGLLGWRGWGLVAELLGPDVVVEPEVEVEDEVEDEVVELELDVLEEAADVVVGEADVVVGEADVVVGEADVVVVEADEVVGEVVAGGRGRAQDMLSDATTPVIRSLRLEIGVPGRTFTWKVSFVPLRSVTLTVQAWARAAGNATIPVVASIAAASASTARSLRRLGRYVLLMITFAGSSKVSAHRGTGSGSY